MATIDIREDGSEIDRIIFSETQSNIGGFCLACSINIEGGDVYIQDNDEHLMIEDAFHALNLIKALNKAIDLGWLK